VNEIVEFLGELYFFFGEFEELFVALEDGLVFFLEVFFGEGLSFGIYFFESLQEFVALLFDS
jgi:hypothetical protein